MPHRQERDAATRGRVHSWLPAAQVTSLQAADHRIHSRHEAVYRLFPQVSTRRLPPLFSFFRPLDTLPCCR